MTKPIVITLPFEADRVVGWLIDTTNVKTFFMLQSRPEIVQGRGAKMSTVHN